MDAHHSGRHPAVQPEPGLGHVYQLGRRRPDLFPELLLLRELRCVMKPSLTRNSHLTLAMKTMTSVWTALTPTLSPRRGSAAMRFIFSNPFLRVATRLHDSCDRETRHARLMLQRFFLRAPSPGAAGEASAEDTIPSGRGEGGQPSSISKFTLKQQLKSIGYWLLASAVLLLSLTISARAEL